MESDIEVTCKCNKCENLFTFRDGDEAINESFSVEESYGDPYIICNKCNNRITLRLR